MTKLGNRDAEFADFFETQSEDLRRLAVLLTSDPSVARISLRNHSFGLTGIGAGSETTIPAPTRAASSSISFEADTGEAFWRSVTSRCRPHCTSRPPRALRTGFLYRTR
jgi:hypothetical protein